MNCKHCGDQVFYLNDAIKERDNRWKHVIDPVRGYIRILGNTDCDKPEPEQ